MLDRELSYRVPFERLTKLGRTMGRRAFGATWWMTWLWIAVFIAACFALPRFERGLEGTGWPRGAGFLVLVAFFLAGFLVIRLRARRQSKSRADFDAEVTFRQDAGGLRIGTKDIEYYLKWPGIAQVLIEPDGLVVSHGSLFFLVPNTAFVSLAERDVLVREIFANLGQDAKERSIAHVGPLLVSPAEGA